MNYIAAENDVIINEACIKWVKKMNDCMYVCTKSTGCSKVGGDTHKVCKNINPLSYAELDVKFEPKNVINPISTLTTN